MEGKKRWAFCQDCRGVSEVYGQLLMIGIVVIAFSTIAVTVFSDGGVVKPEHTPNTDLQEKVNTSTNTIKVFHSGGEDIDLSAIKIILYVNGNPKTEYERDDFSVKNPDGTNSSSDVFSLGDCIVIPLKTEITSGDDIDMFFVDKPSEQVVQRTVLQRGYGEIPYWITPHPYGSAYDNSTDEWLPTELIDEIGDGLLTESVVPKNKWISEDYTFGLDTDEMGILGSLNLVLLKIIYQSHDHSLNNLTLSIYNGSAWTLIASDMPEYKDVDECENANLTTYNITQYVNDTTELENLKVRFSATGNAANASEKIGWVDYVAIHVEY